MEKLKLPQPKVARIGFERVHRMGDIRNRDKRPRNVIAKFSYNKDREEVRMNAKNLKGTNHAIFQQFP